MIIITMITITLQMHQEFLQIVTVKVFSKQLTAVKLSKKTQTAKTPKDTKTQLK